MRNKDDTTQNGIVSEHCPRCDGPLLAVVTHGPGRHHAQPCNCEIGDQPLVDVDDQDVATDGGRELPETLAGFVDRARDRDELRCRNCGDRVNRRYLDNGECVGCQHRLVTDGGVDATAWTDLNAFKRDCLEAISRLERADEQPYGLAIKRDLERAYAATLNHSRLYHNLNELVDTGLVAKTSADGRTNEYTLTATARAMLEERTYQFADATGLAVATPATDGGAR